ncbi:hypothetical protein CQ10_29425 [Bradyrhizobium valentinum]|nr:hypothetical protein CQ10_29425 [Bradyrhizobium valentinum]
MNVQVNFDPNGNGYLNVWRDGVLIVKYQGAIGMAGASYYWKEGIYRAPAPETITAAYSNLDITTGRHRPARHRRGRRPSALATAPLATLAKADAVKMPSADARAAGAAHRPHAASHRIVMCTEGNAQC